METPEITTVASGIYKEGQEYIFNPKVVVPGGEKRGIRLIGDAVQNRKQKFDEDLLRDLNRQVVYYLPEVAGKYRTEGEAAIGAFKIVDKVKVPLDYPIPSGRELELKMRLFGRWLEEQVESLKSRPNDIIGALRLASEAHYGLISPALHPFYDGNGRSARLLANAILMLNAHEQVYYGIKILPVPKMRQETNSHHIDPYLKILNEVHQSQNLTNFDLFMANIWIGNLSRIIEEYGKRAVLNPRLKNAGGNMILMSRFTNRIKMLSRFVEEQTKLGSSGKPHIVPNYFELRYIRR